jgi:hypothetical protein
VCYQLSFIYPEAKNCWWIKRAEFTKGRQILADCPTISTCSDASLSGWVGGGKQIDQNRGPWTSTDSKRHINELELLATFNGLKCFVSSIAYSTLEFNIDNTTAES